MRKERERKKVDMIFSSVCLLCYIESQKLTRTHRMMESSASIHCNLNKKGKNYLKLDLFFTASDYVHLLLNVQNLKIRCFWFYYVDIQKIFFSVSFRVNWG